MTANLGKASVNLYWKVAGRADDQPINDSRFCFSYGYLLGPKTCSNFVA